MSAVVDPVSRLEFTELSHRWGYNSPTWPGFEDLRIHRVVNHAKHGVMTQIYKGTMHVSTHVNAPLHLIAGAHGVGQIPMDRFFGNGVVLPIPKGKWELVRAVDLDNAQSAVRANDIVVIVTGWHHRYSDSQEYFGHAPGLAPDAAQWLVARRVKLVAIDTAAVDHPLATSLGPHRNGPQMKYLAGDYEAATGRNPRPDHPEWNAAHKALLSAGIPTIENVGGDVDRVLGKRCTFQAMPWNWHEGDACVVRFVAIHDASGQIRIETGLAV